MQNVTKNTLALASQVIAYKIDQRGKNKKQKRKN